MTDGPRVVQNDDEYPRRPRAVRRLTGKTTTGFEVNARAFADPLPDSLDYGPFRGEGEVSVKRAGYYVVNNVDFAEIPEIIALLQQLLDAASTP